MKKSKEEYISELVERIMAKKNSFTIRYKDVSFSPKVVRVLEKLRDGKDVNIKALTSRERNDVGVCYWYGHIVALDYEEAVRWYMAAAEKGRCCRAEFNLYVCHKRGTGVEQDMEKAVFWIKKAAKHNDVSAQHILAEYYYKGNEVRRSRSLAKYWFDKCLANPDLKEEPVVMFLLGISFQQGDYGFEKDEERAREFFETAAEGGCPLAVMKLVEIYNNYDRTKVVQWMGENKEFVCYTFNL